MYILGNWIIDILMHFVHLQVLNKRVKTSNSEFLKTHGLQVTINATVCLMMLINMKQLQTGHYFHEYDFSI